MSTELFGAKIIGVGTANKNLRRVHNEEIVETLSTHREKTWQWWNTDAARVWWSTNGEGVQKLWTEFTTRYKRKNGSEYPKEKIELSEEERVQLFSELVDQRFTTSDQWIKENIGPQFRYFVDKEGISTVDLARDAAEEAMATAKLEPKNIDGIYFATVTPDHLYSPPPSALLQRQLGIPVSNDDGIRPFSFADVNEACSSFMAAWKLAYQEIHLGKAETVLLIGADVMSTTISPFSRNFYPILGDGGRALILQRVPLAENCFSLKGFLTHLNGQLSHLIMTPTGGSKKYITAETLTNPFDQGHMLDMQGPLVKKHAQNVLISRILERLPKTIIIRALEQYLGKPIRTKEEVADALNTFQLFVAHQANLASINRPVEEILRELGYKGEFFDTMEHEGNTTSASVPGCIIEAAEQGILRPGMKVLAVAFGGGFTAATCLFTWTLDL